MTDKLTLRDEIDRAIELREKATEGEWSHTGEDDADFIVWAEGENAFICNIGNQRIQLIGDLRCFDADQADAAFITHAANHGKEIAELARDALELASAVYQGDDPIDLARAVLDRAGEVG